MFDPNIAEFHSIYHGSSRLDSFQLKVIDIHHKNINCGYILETPQQGSSNEYPQHTFLYKKIEKRFIWIYVAMMHKHCQQKAKIHIVSTCRGMSARLA